MQALHMKISFVFIKKDFAFSLAFRMRFKATRKWPTNEVIHNIGKKEADTKQVHSQHQCSQWQIGQKSREQNAG